MWGPQMAKPRMTLKLWRSRIPLLPPPSSLGKGGARGSTLAQTL